jgi:uncharacterized protein
MSDRLDTDNVKSGRPDDGSVYLDCVRELLEHDKVKSMHCYMQHRGVDCLEHSLNVSVASFRICRRLGLDFRSAARGGLLHDFFLYDWHKENPYGGLHGFRHPKIAAMNADKHFTLNKREQDVIKKHMWPLTLALPKYPETFVVICVDKFFCVAEAFRNPGSALVKKLHETACRKALLGQ